MSHLGYPGRIVRAIPNRVKAGQRKGRPENWQTSPAPEARVTAVAGPGNHSSVGPVTVCGAFNGRGRETVKHILIPCKGDDTD